MYIFYCRPSVFIAATVHDAEYLYEGLCRVEAQERTWLVPWIRCSSGWSRGVTIMKPVPTSIYVQLKRPWEPEIGVIDAGKRGQFFFKSLRRLYNEWINYTNNKAQNFRRRRMNIEPHQKFNRSSLSETTRLITTLSYIRQGGCPECLSSTNKNKISLAIIFITKSSSIREGPQSIDIQ